MRSLRKMSVQTLKPAVVQGALRLKTLSVHGLKREAIQRPDSSADVLEEVRKGWSVSEILNITRAALRKYMIIQCDSKLLSGFPWPIIFKPKETK
jgi:hypothetical protein